MSGEARELSFGDVDGLGFAATEGRLRSCAMRSFAARRLGPLLEAAHLSAAGLLPRHPWRATSASVAGLVAALDDKHGFWSGPGDSEETGFVRTERWGERYDTRLTSLLMRAKRAGQLVSGLSAQVSGQLAAAMGELESNIHDHAESPETGVVAYRAEAGAFEFVVSDRGVGILASLRRNAEYAGLADAGVALRAALTEGVSRYGRGSGRGFRVQADIHGAHGPVCRTAVQVGRPGGDDGRNRSRGGHRQSFGEGAADGILRQCAVSRAASGRRGMSGGSTAGMRTTIGQDDFARRFSVRGANLMWLLGAGASNAAGLPTAHDNGAQQCRVEAPTRLCEERFLTHAGNLRPEKGRSAGGL